MKSNTFSLLFYRRLYVQNVHKEKLIDASQPRASREAGFRRGIRGIGEGSGAHHRTAAMIRFSPLRSSSLCESKTFDDRSTLCG
jgi:hypothetical protein